MTQVTNSKIMARLVQAGNDGNDGEDDAVVLLACYQMIEQILPALKELIVGAGEEYDFEAMTNGDAANLVEGLEYRWRHFDAEASVDQCRTIINDLLDRMDALK